MKIYINVQISQPNFVQYFHIKLLTFWHYSVIMSTWRGGSNIKAITIRFSDKIHKAIKHKLVDENKSIQEYIISLVKNDLSFTDDMDDLTDYLPKKKK